MKADETLNLNLNSGGGEVIHVHPRIDEIKNENKK
jgi:hypothetical protein